MSNRAITKVLSANDVGSTGGHQAGILIPKEEEILSFFPELDPQAYNPRDVLDVDDDAGGEWTFNFIYYNNKLSGGTRNEYRLTGMTKYFRENDLKAGDSITLRKFGSRTIQITYQRSSPKTKILELSTTWRVVYTEF